MNRVTDPVLFALLSAIRSDGRALGYPLHAIRAGCKAVRERLDAADMPDGLTLMESYHAGRDAMRRQA